MSWPIRRWIMLAAVKLAGMKAATYRGTYEHNDVVIVLFDASMKHNSMHWGGEGSLTQHDLYSTAAGDTICVDVKNAARPRTTIDAAFTFRIPNFDLEGDLTAAYGTIEQKTRQEIAKLCDQRIAACLHDRADATGWEEGDDTYKRVNGCSRCWEAAEIRDLILPPHPDATDHPTPPVPNPGEAP